MGYSIIKADLSRDKNHIIALWRRNFQNVPEERYSWMYLNNPAGPATCWLAVSSREKSAVGAAALFPRRIFLYGNPMNAGICGDFVVDKEHRGLGPALSLQKKLISECTEKGITVIYGLPNTQSELILRRAGYSVLGDVIKMTKPFRSYYYMKKHIHVPVITKTVSKTVDLAMQIISKENCYKNTDGYVCGIFSSFDERFDELWQRVSTGFPIIGERSSAYLNWRFAHYPHIEKSIFILANNGGNILGYIVFNIFENRISIVDILCLSTDIALDSLLSEFLLFQRKQGIDSVSISYAGNNHFTRKLQEFGFSIRDKRSKVVVYLHPDYSDSSFLLNVENWYLLAGDNDI